MNYIEQNYQIAVIDYLRKMYPTVKFTISPANAANPRQGARNKAMGYVKGTPDILIFKRNKDFNGLFIELKTPEIRDIDGVIRQRKGEVSKEQKEWIEYLRKEGYLPIVCYGSNPAMNMIDEYMSNV